MNVAEFWTTVLFPGELRTGKLPALESVVPIQPAEGSTNMSIHPPKPTLFMVMSAFAGRELMMQAYETAVAEEYRFFSMTTAC